MTQSLQLGGGPGGTAAPKDIRRLNRLPIIAAAVLGILFLAVIFYGLTSRGLVFRSTSDAGTRGGAPATTFADQMKRGVADGIIGDGQPQPLPTQDTEPKPVQQNPFVSPQQPVTSETKVSPLESEEAWRARLAREGQEQFLREQQRQRMARLQASNIALDSPLAIDTQKIKATTANAATARPTTAATASSSPADLYSLALQAGLNGQNLDPNGQAKKENFFNSDLAKLGYLPNQVVPPRSYYELKRGSVIPATLITGINSDLPGRITAQVSQNVYDSRLKVFCKL